MLGTRAGNDVDVDVDVDVDLEYYWWMKSSQAARADIP
jgi:hypothetical protein